MTQEADLISLHKYPTAPMPWVTKKPGDSYVWGDYVLLFQVHPPMIADGMQMMAAFLEKGKVQPGASASPALTYLYSLTVLYRRQINPSSRPVRLFGLEQVDMAKAPPELRDHAPADMPPMIGEFAPGARFNLGEYSGNLVYRDVRDKLLECARRSLGLTGEPEWIGAVADAKGHPKTGIQKGALDLPASRKAGCLSCIAILSGAGALALDLIQ